MSITGERDDRLGGGPQKVGIALADIMTGMYSTIAILAAINHRHKSGEGQYIDMSLMDCIVALGSNQITGYLASGEVPQRMGNAHMSLVPYGVYPVKDGHIIIAVGNDEQWQRYCDTIDRPDLGGNSNYSRVTDRIVNREKLDVELNKTMMTRNLKDWLKRLEANQVPCGPINDYEHVFQNEQVRHRKLHLDQVRGDGARIGSAASPINLQATPPSYDLPPPRLSEHTDEVLRTLLGLSTAEIQTLRDTNII